MGCCLGGSLLSMRKWGRQFLSGKPSVTDKIDCYQQDLTAEFLFYTSSEHEKAPGAHFATVSGYSLEVFL